MSNKSEIRFAGSGGQGVILASIILADAAVRDGKYAIQSQSYGPEARGGMCKAEAIISDEEIGFPKVRHTTFLLALTQTSLERYIKDADENCVVMIDSSLEKPQTPFSGKMVRVPILETAREKLKKPMTGNIVALGAVNAYMKFVDEKILEEAVLDRVPKGTEELNRKALAEGRVIVETEIEDVI